MSLTKCEFCGEQKKLVGSSFTRGTRPRSEGAADGKIGLQTECVNPDCPSKDTDMAKAREPGSS